MSARVTSSQSTVRKGLLNMNSNQNSQIYQNSSFHNNDGINIRGNTTHTQPDPTEAVHSSSALFTHQNNFNDTNKHETELIQHDQTPVEAAASASGIDDDDELLGNKDFQRVSTLWKSMRESRKSLDANKLILERSNLFTEQQQQQMQNNSQNDLHLRLSNRQQSVSHRGSPTQSPKVSGERRSSASYQQQQQQQYQKQRNQKNQHEIDESQSSSEKGSTELIFKMKKQALELEQCQNQMVKLSATNAAMSNQIRLMNQRFSHFSNSSKDYLERSRASASQIGMNLYENEIEMDSLRATQEHLQIENEDLLQRLTRVTEQLTSKTNESDRLRSRLIEVEDVIDEVFKERSQKTAQDSQEIASLKSDIDRLIRLLSSTSEFKEIRVLAESANQIHYLRDFTNYQNSIEGGADVAESRAKTGLLGGRLCSTCQNQPSHNQPRFISASLQSSIGAGKRENSTKPNEHLSWVPKTAFELIESLRARSTVKLSRIEAEELLFGINSIFAEVDRKKTANLMKELDQAKAEVKRLLAKTTSFDEIQAKNKLSRLKSQFSNSKRTSHQTSVAAASSGQVCAHSLNRRSSPPSGKERIVYYSDVQRLFTEYECSLRVKDEELTRWKDLANQADNAHNRVASSTAGAFDSARSAIERISLAHAQREFAQLSEKILRCLPSSQNAIADELRSQHSSLFSFFTDVLESIAVKCTELKLAALTSLEEEKQEEQSKHSTQFLISQATTANRSTSKPQQQQQDDNSIITIAASTSAHKVSTNKQSIQPTKDICNQQQQQLNLRNENICPAKNGVTTASNATARRNTSALIYSSNQNQSGSSTTYHNNSSHNNSNNKNNHQSNNPQKLSQIHISSTLPATAVCMDDQLQRKRLVSNWVEEQQQQNTSKDQVIHSRRNSMHSSTEKNFTSQHQNQPLSYYYQHASLTRDDLYGEGQYANEESYISQQQQHPREKQNENSSNSNNNSQEKDSRFYYKTNYSTAHTNKQYGSDSAGARGVQSQMQPPPLHDSKMNSYRNYKVEGNSATQITGKSNSLNNSFLTAPTTSVMMPSAVITNSSLRHTEQKHSQHQHSRSKQQSHSRNHSGYNVMQDVGREKQSQSNSNSFSHY